MARGTNGRYGARLPDSELVKYSRSLGRGSSALGESVADIEKEKRLREFQNSKLKLEQDNFNATRSDRQDDVNYRNKAYTDSRNDKQDDKIYKDKIFNADIDYKNKTFEHNVKNDDRNYGLSSAKLSLMQQEANGNNGLKPIYSNGVAFLPLRDESGNVSYKALMPDKNSKSITKEAPYGFNSDGTTKTAIQYGEEQTELRKKKFYGDTGSIKID